jgi:MFS family permease
MADRFGRKKILLVGLTGYAAGFLLFGLYIDSIPVMYAARILSGVFSGALYAAAMSTIADLSDDSNRNKHLGLAGMAIGMGFIVGPASGGFLSILGYDVPFFVSALIMSMMIPVVLFAMKEVPKEAGLNKEERSLLPSFKLPGGAALRTLLLVAFITSFLLAGLEGVFQVYGRDAINMTPAQMGTLFLISGVALALVQGGLLRKVKTGQEYKWMTVGQLLSGSAFILMALTFNLTLAGLYLIMFVVGNTVIRTLSLSLITRASGSRTGYASGLQYSADSMGRITGPLLFAVIYDWRNEQLFLIAGTVSLIFVIFIYVNGKKFYKEYHEVLKSSKPKES